MTVVSEILMSLINKLSYSDVPPPPVVGGTVGVGGNQRGVWGVVPEVQALGVMLRTAAGDLLLLLK